MRTTYHHWTCPDERFIENNYLWRTDEEIAALMGLTKSQVVRHRIDAMGLRKRGNYRKAA